MWRKGNSTSKDRGGNDKSDKLADKGVEEFAGKGLVKLGKWCEARQKQYRFVFVRVHKIIVGDTLAEKEERVESRVMQKALLGYDPQKWVKANAEIRDEEHLEVEYQSLKTIQPTKGKHRFAHCQILYEEVHAFLKQRRWVPVKVDMEVAGITWMELFTLYDLTGSRSEKGQHQKNREATRGAGKKRQKARCARTKKLNLNETTVVTKPTLDE